MKREDVEAAFAELESRRAELGAIEQNRAAVADAAEEALRGKSTLDAVKGAAPGEELLVPVGAGTFVFATLKDNKTVLSGIGSGLSLERGLDDAVKTLEERLQMLQSTEDRLAKESARLQSEIQAISEILQKASPE
ncbi:MAG: prefoldin subunit alpha [Methanobacteriota archaeon]